MIDDRLGYIDLCITALSLAKLCRQLKESTKHWPCQAQGSHGKYGLTR
jgi:hypothetical protein